MFSKFLYRLSLVIIFTFISTILKDIEGQLCEPGCQREIEAIQVSVANLRTDLDAAIRDVRLLQTKTSELELFYYDDIFPFMDRINKWQPQVTNNFTSIANKLESEMVQVYAYLEAQIQTMKSEMNGRINDLVSEVAYIRQNLPTTPTSPTNPGSVQDVYWNLTQKINNLELGKIQNLSADNVMWRRNFRVINATFERMKRNNCLC